MYTSRGKSKIRKIESGERAGQFAYSIIANEIRLIPNGKKSADKEKSQTHDAFEDSEIPF